MFHPIGGQSSSVYWRRRLFVGFAVVALIALVLVTAKVALGGGAHTPVAGGSSSSVAHSPSTPRPSTSAVHSSSVVTTPSESGAGSGSPMPIPCVASQLSVAATTGAPTYNVGAQPVLSLQVTNTGTASCTQNLADSQIVLTVYNGLSRVWGSHDCEIQPGTDLRTLTAHETVAISVVWSGRSSEPKCAAGTRQQVGAGSYTLIPALSGHSGKAAQFAIH